jgi:uncharacterized small protein (DUF1192 family)
MFDADPEREAERAQLLQERNRLRAMLLGDADPELKNRIEQLEAAIKRLDAGSAGSA